MALTPFEKAIADYSREIDSVLENPLEGFAKGWAAAEKYYLREIRKLQSEMERRIANIEDEAKEGVCDEFDDIPF